MRRFVLKENLRLYRQRLADEKSESQPQASQSRIRSAQCEFALLESISSSIGAPANRDDKL
jgi:hypothetical protein